MIDKVIMFFLGFIVGAYLGVICMALMAMRGRDSEDSFQEFGGLLRSDGGSRDNGGRNGEDYDG